MDMAEVERIETDGLRGLLKRKHPMRAHVSWRAGGDADFAYVPADLSDLQMFLQRIPTDEPVMFVGLGSNLLIRDGGFRGTVVFTHRVLARLFLEESPGYAAVYAEAGVASPKVARFAAVNNLEGAEFFAGIPGTVGGALAMNAGCYGHETWNAVARVRTIDRAGRLQIREPHEFTVGYRSVFALSHDEFFVAAWFHFPHGDGDSARRKIKELLTRRIATQPLAQPNAGSVFRNPPEDHAARLIEASGLKGRCVGSAEVSTLHANFIINKGDASAHDIEELMSFVQKTVKQQTGVALEREVQIVGEP